MKPNHSVEDARRVVIAVLTYRREAKLRHCLESIARALENTSDEVDIIIGDNAPESEEIETYLPNACRLQIGAGRVAEGRQALLEEARRKEYDYLIFIDDDEVVSNTWYRSIVNLAIRAGSSAVTGPVLPIALPARLCVLYSRPRHQTGTLVEAAGAGNLLLNLHLTKNVNFDRSWGLKGGEDTDFTLRLTSDGGSISWCDEALVYEPVDEGRLSLSWLLDRQFNNGIILHRAFDKSGRHVEWSNLVLRLTSGLIHTSLLPIGLVFPRVLSLCLSRGVKQLGFVLEASRARVLVRIERRVDRTID